MKAILFAALFLFVCSLSSTYPQEGYRVIDSADIGVCPVEVFMSPDNNYFYAICAGYDANFNGIEEEGDARPSIWKIETENDIFVWIHRVLTLEFNALKFPVRFGYNGSILYLPSRNKILEIDCENDTLLNEYPTTGDPSDVKYTQNGLQICFPGPAGSNGFIGEYRLPDMRKRWEVPVGINLQESLVLNNRSFAALCVGPYGKDSSQVWFGTVNDDDTVTNFEKYTIGATGNHLYNFLDLRIFATSNGSHKVTRLHQNSNWADTLYTETTGFDGPRETIEFHNNVFVTTYAGDVRIYDFNSKTPSQIVPLDGKAEGICATGWFVPEGGGRANVFVASPFKKDYSPNTKLYFLRKTFASVSESLANAPFSIYPTPARDNLTVKFDNAPLGAKIEIRDAAGKLIKSSEANEELANVDLLGVAQGAYFAVISIGDKVWSAPFTVVR